jgi:hypothetical protein
MTRAEALTALRAAMEAFHTHSARRPSRTEAGEFDIEAIDEGFALAEAVAVAQENLTAIDMAAMAA